VYQDVLCLSASTLNDIKTCILTNAVGISLLDNVHYIVSLLPLQTPCETEKWSSSSLDLFRSSRRHLSGEEKSPLCMPRDPGSACRHGNYKALQHVGCRSEFGLQMKAFTNAPLVIVQQGHVNN